MKLPVLVINFKTYNEARGNKGLELSKKIEMIAKEFGVNFIIAPQLVDMATIANQIDLPVFSQHIDPIPPGNATGHIDIYSVKDAGVTGTLVNHSEKRLELSVLENCVTLANENDLFSVVCAGTIGISRAVSAFHPWAVAMEPPELIGGNVSVTTRPQAIKNTVKVVKSVDPNIIPLTGAGVKSAEHLEAAIKLGSRGVLLASGIVKAANQSQVLTEMAKAMMDY